MNIFTKKDTRSDIEQKEHEYELANSYLQVMSTYAWKDLMEFIDNLEASVIGDVDNCDLTQLTAASFGRLRGIREVAHKIKKHIEFSVNRKTVD